MSTDVFIGLQVLIVLLLAIGMLLLLLRRQKKTIQQLQAILTDVKEDISGESLLRHFKLEIDNTTAHCRQDTIALRPELGAEDMAISLRFIALQNELALVQNEAANKTPWREQIKRYEELAQSILEQINARVENNTRVINDARNDELEEKNKSIEELKSTLTNLQQQIKELKPLQDFVGTATTDSLTSAEIEHKLHLALVSLCENFSGTQKLRELVYLLHEAFNEMGARNENTMMHYTQNEEGQDNS